MNSVVRVSVLMVVVVAAAVVAQGPRGSFLATLNSQQIAYLSSAAGLDAISLCYQQRNNPQCNDLVLRTVAELPELVRSNCKICNSPQRQTYQSIISEVNANHPAKFDALRKLFIG
ncbi:uncharacterized protein [Procambarus clarkii]|uniref:uncharacterized protein n=1 Tax=Procambarus clarkii TaxID=6728 RepID=UPI001E675CBF|nr:uncharacterized protein LOC123767715 [Procambarus clarkii]